MDNTHKRGRHVRRDPGLLDWLDPFLGIHKNPARPIGNPNNPLVKVKINLDLIDSMGTGEKSDLEGEEVGQTE